MNKITAFRNAAEFQRIFGVQEHGNGVKSRRNKILLQFYKSKSIWDFCRKHNGKYDYFFGLRNMVDLKEYIIDVIHDQLIRNASSSTKDFYPVKLMGRTYWSSVYSTDENKGIPSNGNVGYVRYVTHEENRNGKVYRMRAGRFYKRLLLESELGRALPEQVLNWLCEQFTEMWSSYVARTLPHFTLHVDRDFYRIYSYNEDNGCTYDFNSCMMDDDQWQFYRDCVSAKAAYLTNDDDRVIARCIIFTDVKDQDGNTWRLAERQYAQEGRDLYKRCLVDALIEGGHIDGYKQVGVDCHSTTAYVDKNGNSLMNKRFSINCELDFSYDSDYAWENEKNHILSYQDSFKFYDFKLRKAFNTEPKDMTNVSMLDTTRHYLEGFWDEYHDDWCVNYFFVWYNGNEMRCDRNRLEDFIEHRDGYFIHKDNFVKCPVCGCDMPDPKYYATRSRLVFTFKDGEKTTHVCSRSCLIKLQEEKEASAYKYRFYDNFSGHTIKSNTERPVAILHPFMEELHIVKCSSNDFQSRVQRNDIAVVVTKDGFYIPIVSFVENPQELWNKYESKNIELARMKVDEILHMNYENGVNSIYA